MTQDGRDERAERDERDGTQAGGASKAHALPYFCKIGLRAGLRRVNEGEL